MLFVLLSVCVNSPKIKQKALRAGFKAVTSKIASQDNMAQIHTTVSGFSRPKEGGNTNNYTKVI